MPKRVVIHPGFHKTGTSTVQRALRVNRSLLKPYLRSILKPPLKETCHASRGYSTWRDPISLHKFRRRFRAVLKDISAMPRRTLLISAEELSGHLPGRDGLDSYAAAPVLARVMRETVAGVMPQTELIFYYSTRSPDPWMRSAYWQHVRASSMTLDFDEYATRYCGSADLDGIVDAVAADVETGVHRAVLDETGDLPAGPATPLLDLCDVPREIQAQMQTETINTHLGEDVLQALLQANRAHSDHDARSAAKSAILTAAEGAT